MNLISSKNYDRDPVLPETDLVLSAVTLDFDYSVREQIESILTDDISWSRVLSIANVHEVVPTVRINLLRCCSNRLPSWVKARVDNECLSIAAANLQSARDLVQVFESLQRSAIPSLAFKGPTLSMQTYGKLSLRHSRDLDILVERDRIHEALSVLQSLGYERASFYGRISSIEILKTDKHIQLTRPSTGVNLEVHWAIALPQSSIRTDFDALWHRKQRIKILDHSIPSPGVEDLLLILCIHGANHGWGTLKWILDVAQFIQRSSDLDWTQVLTRAEDLGCRRLLSIGLVLARDVIGSPLPHTVGDYLKSDRIAEQISAEWRARLFFPKGAPPGIAQTLIQIRSRERFRDRLRIAMRLFESKVKYWRSATRALITCLIDRSNARDSAFLFRSR